MNARTSRNLRAAYYRNMTVRERQRLTLNVEPPPSPDAPPLNLPPLAGCLAGICIVLGRAALGWGVVIGLAWMICGWLL